MSKLKVEDDTVRSKLALLQLADELSSVTKACDIMGYSRDSYYRFKKLYDSGGELALRNLDRRKPMLKNRTSPEVEKEVVEIALDYPNYGQEKVARLLQARDIKISASGVRAVWKRHDLESKNKRLKALHAKVAQDQRQLTDEQRSSIEKLHQLNQNQTELDTAFPGNLGVQDSYYVGYIPTIGDVYQQTFIDAYTKVAMVNLYLNKHASSSIHMLNGKVLPWYQQHKLTIKQILTDRGAEFYGAAHDGDLYQKALQEKSIEHIKMRAYNGPEVNGICARFHTLQKNEFYDLALRAKSYQSLSELNEDLQKWVEFYNSEMPHQERYCFGKTPLETLKQSLHLAQK